MRDLLQVILRNVLIDPETGCWIWRGRLDKDGYGRLGNKLVHRITWVMTNGPIPVGMCLDHIQCDNPPCCRPDHLELSTPIANTMRGNSPPARNARKVECIRGHSLTDASNVYRWRRSRICRTCRRAYRKREKARAA